ncbi:hypothetical protein SLS58_005106 [Diplodia intermedia]|uniref:Uncharacterized protein n=1 Tax=Diplodia intermedia TaxID=856260 RepID=A0ABR3TS42_9PEZI
MPMNWNAEADAKLLLGILKIYDIKINKGPMLDELNAFMGPDCVGLAITNRITRLKKAAEADGIGTASGSVTPAAKTPKSGKRKNGNASGDSSQDNEESPTKKRAGAKAASTPKREMSKSGGEDGDEGELSDKDIKQVASVLKTEKEEA